MTKNDLPKADIIGLRGFVIIRSDGSTEEIPTHSEEFFRVPALTELRGILSAISYMLKTPDGESVLAQCAKIARQHEMSWPEYHLRMMEKLNARRDFEAAGTKTGRFSTTEPNSSAESRDERINAPGALIERIDAGETRAGPTQESS